MKEQDKKEYHENYEKAKKKGVFFFPDILWKDAIAALVVLILLITLAFISGSTLEEPANPADTTYTPKPEWYFLFLYQMLKYFPGELEVVAIVVLPGILLGALFFLPYIDRGKFRHPLNRPLITGATILVVAGIITLTILAIVEQPPPIPPGEGGAVARLYS